MSETKLDLTDEDIERIKVFKDTYNALYISNFSDDKLNYVKSIFNFVVSFL